MEDMSELTAEEQAKLLRHELEAVYGSSSYKIGRAVTCLSPCTHLSDTLLVEV